MPRRDVHRATACSLAMRRHCIKRSVNTRGKPVHQFIREGKGMRRILSSMMVVLLIALCLYAQTPTDAAELTNLLIAFLAGASRHDAAVHDRFWAEDLLYTGSSGR